ncbi:MAG: hypothetical protein ACM37W_11015 [Actinomycetota bacterium]
MKNLDLVKKSKEIFKVALINLVVLLVFLEIGSLGFYWLKHKQFFYTRDLSKDNEFQKQLEGVRLSDSIVERFHPFFGFVQKPSLDFRPGFKVNNYGFISPYDYPYKKKSKKQFIIGIFGGSVASNFSIFEVKNKIIANQLKQKIPQLKNKDIIVLSFATGGYKQPQQLLILNYFLALGQEFDMVINIDGFNEVALSNLNNHNQVDIAMPSIQHILPLTNLANNSLSPKALTALLRIQQIKTQLKESLDGLKECKIATCHAFTSLYLHSLLNNYQKEIVRFDREKEKRTEEGSVIYLNTNRSILKDEVAFEQMASLWAKSSIGMHKVLLPNQVFYFHFLQPNQYYKTNRVFSEKEKKIAFNNETPYAKSVEIGYPLLFNKTKNFQKNNINFFNAAYVLDDVKDPVYVDNCCHYNAIGEKTFANYVADIIVKVLSKK